MTYSPNPLHPSAANNVILERLAYRIFNHVMGDPELLPLLEGGGCEALSYLLGEELRYVYWVEEDVIAMARAVGVEIPPRWDFSHWV